MNAYATNGWTALGDPTRRAIFERLVERPRAVTELASELPVSRPAVSQHLKVLRDAGLVRSVGPGRLSAYELDPAPLLEIEAWARAVAGSDPDAR